MTQLVTHALPSITKKTTTSSRHHERRATFDDEYEYRCFGAGSYARREAQSMALKSEHHRWLVEALLRVVTGMSDTAAIEQYVMEIVTPLIQVRTDAYALYTYVYVLYTLVYILYTYV
jgi:hypothetical protein